MKSNLTGAALALIFLCFEFSTGYSQQTVAIGDSNPKANAILYLKGNGNQGLIIPIVSSLGNFGEAGMVVYNSTDKKIHYHDGSSWTVVGGGGAVTTDLIVGNEVSGVGANGALQLAGSGTTASPLTVSMISGTTTGQILKWNNATAKWELGTDNAGSTVLNSAQILVGNASNVATPATMSGDATLSNAGALTISSGAVNSAKILDGAITNADVAATAAIAPSKIGQNAAANGQVLKWNGTAWAPADDNAGSVALNSTQILVGNAANVPTATTVSGDATLSNTGALTLGTGSVNSAKILDGAITNVDVAPAAAIAPSKLGQASATAGQVLEWNGTAWAPATDDAGSVALNSTQILVGNAANVPTATTVSGDATLSNTGALTLGTGSVNSAKILDGAITNVDVAPAAAIAPSKLGQASATAGQVLEWNGTAWAPATDDAGSVALNSTQILVGNAANVPTATTVSGDATLSNTGALTLGTGSVNSAKILDGAITNTDIAAAAAIAPSKIGQAAATNGQVLEWNGTAWAPAGDDGLSTTLNSGQILVGNVSNTAAPVTMSGDATLTNAGALTIANSAVNSAKIADFSIANADISASAAIAGTKVTPNFGAQNIITTGSVYSQTLNASGQVMFNALAGTGTRMVTTDDTGILGFQSVPAGFSTLNMIPKGDGATGMIASQIFDDGANVGIGTVAPTYLLDVHKTLTSGIDANIRAYNPSNTTGDKAGIRLGVGASWAVHLNTVLSGDWLELTNNAGTAAHRWNFQSYYPGAGNAYITGTGVDLALMGGFTGIGTLSPDRKLDISDAVWPLLRLNSTTPGAAIELVSATNDDWMISSWSNSFWLSLSTDNFSTKTDQYVFTTASFYPWNDATKNLGGPGNRWINVYAQNGTIQTSDARLKNNIKDLTYGLDEVLALRPVSYSWKSDPSSKKIGFIAQDVQKLIPEVVSNEEFLGLNYAEMVPVLVNAIQEQQQKIEQLEQKIKSLETQKQADIESFKAELSEIRKVLGMQASTGKK